MTVLPRRLQLQLKLHKWVFLELAVSISVTSFIIKAVMLTEEVNKFLICGAIKVIGLLLLSQFPRYLIFIAVKLPSWWFSLLLVVVIFHRLLPVTSDMAIISWYQARRKQFGIGVAKNRLEEGGGGRRKICTPPLLGLHVTCRPHGTFFKVEY